MGVPNIGPTPTGNEVPRFNQIGGGPGGLTLTEIEVDFGTDTQRSKSFTITDASVSTSSLILAFQSGNPATGRGKDDAAWDSITYSAKPGTGNFVLIGHASGRVKGKRKVLYAVA